MLTLILLKILCVIIVVSIIVLIISFLEIIICFIELKNIKKQLTKTELIYLRERLIK